MRECAFCDEPLCPCCEECHSPECSLDEGYDDEFDEDEVYDDDYPVDGYWW